MIGKGNKIKSVSQKIKLFAYKTLASIWYFFKSKDSSEVILLDKSLYDFLSRKMNKTWTTLQFSSIEPLQK